MTTKIPKRLLPLVLAVSAASALARSAEAPLPWGDQGDGTYRNPILSADYSDPEVVRVGDDFYLVASDFHFVGIQVLHSRDLVNWRVVGQVFDRLSMAPKYDEMQGYAQGTWAPALRYHDGTYYLFVCTPKDGLFLWTAKNPAGPWSEMVTVKAVEGWEDPCPFWDADGRAYLVRSKVGAGPLILHRMSPDGRQLLDEGVEIYRGPVAEGPKLFKRNGWYFISLPEGGVEKGGQTILRSRTIQGPYERRRRPGRRQPAPGRSRRPAERRRLVRRVQIDGPSRADHAPAAGPVGEGRLAGVRRRGPHRRGREEAGRRPRHAALAPADERRLRRRDAGTAVAVEPQPRARRLVGHGARRFPEAPTAPRDRADARAEHVDAEALGPARPRGRAARRARPRRRTARRLRVPEREGLRADRRRARGGRVARLLGGRRRRSRGAGRLAARRLRGRRGPALLERGRRRLDGLGRARDARSSRRGRARGSRSSRTGRARAPPTSTRSATGTARSTRGPDDGSVRQDAPQPADGLRHLVRLGAAVPEHEAAARGPSRRSRTTAA